MKKYLLTLIAVLTASSALAGGVNPEVKIFTVNTIEGVPMSFRVTSEERNICMVVAIPKNTTGTVTIPEWANDYSVESIGPGAFRECRQLTEVIIPEGVTRIEENVFYECRGLSTMSLPESLYRIYESAFKNCTGLTSIVIHNNCRTVEESAFMGCISLASVILPESMTKIERTTFKECISLTSITLPENLQEIRDGAFSDCELLSSFHIPASVNRIDGNPIKGCKALASITVASDNTVYDSRENCNAIVETASNCLIAACKNTVIPEGITSIYEDAFRGCSGMTTLHIPASLTAGLSYQYNSFSGLSTDLTTITVAEGNPIYDSRSNCNAIIETATNTLILGCRTTVIPQGVTTIGYGAFYRCVSLTAMSIPNSVTSIEDNAFKETGLTSINIPSSVKTIGHGGFEYCFNMTSVSLSEGLESIGEGCFSFCGITSLTIPASVTQIGDGKKYFYLYSYCSKLETLIVSQGNKVYDSRKDCNAIIETSTNKLINGCKNTVIPEGVTAIGDYAFQYCTGLKNLVIPKSVREIQSSAFRYCYNLESISVTRGNIYYDSRSNCNAIIDIAKKKLILGCKNTVIPQSVTEIGSYAFAMHPITSITIPANITDIGSSLFYGCTKMESVTSLIEEPFEIKRSVFGLNALQDKLFDENGLKISLEEYKGLEDDNIRYSYNEEKYLHENMTLYVPQGTKAKYEATPCWNEFKEIIEIGSSDIKEAIQNSNQGQETNVWYSIDGAKYNGKPQKKGIYIHQGEKYVIK